jgi:phage FluMu protein Com
MIKGNKFYYGEASYEHIELPGNILKVVIAPDNNPTIYTVDGEYTLYNYPDPSLMCLSEIKHNPMLQQLRCPRCGKRVLDTEGYSTFEIPCRHCKTFIRYDKGTITMPEK